MALELIRKNGANVTAYDDSIMFDNALLNQNGIIDKVGNMMDAYAEGNNLIIRDGYAIIKGRQFKISGTESVTLQKPSSGNFYYLIYAQVNTEGSVETVTINATYQTNDYPTISIGEDIVADKNGIANLPLFTVRTSSSGVEEINKVASLISSTNLISATVKELKKYTDDTDANRKNYIDTKFTELNNVVTPFLSVKVINHSDGEQVNTIDINSLFKTGNEMYLLVILNIKDLGSTSDSANNVDPNTFIAKLYSSATVTYRYNVKASSDSTLIARTNYQRSAGFNLLELRDDAGATIYTIQKVPNTNTIHIKALNDWMAQEIPLSTDATNKLIGRFNLYQFI